VIALAGAARAADAERIFAGMVETHCPAALIVGGTIRILAARRRRV